MYVEILLSRIERIRTASIAAEVILKRTARSWRAFVLTARSVTWMRTACGGVPGTGMLLSPPFWCGWPGCAGWTEGALTFMRVSISSMSDTTPTKPPWCFTRRSWHVVRSLILLCRTVTTSPMPIEATLVLLDDVLVVEGTGKGAVVPGCEWVDTMWLLAARVCACLFFWCAFGGGQVLENIDWIDPEGICECIELDSGGPNGTPPCLNEISSPSSSKSISWIQNNLPKLKVKNLTS